jgi:hypothetical protein
MKLPVELLCRIVGSLHPIDILSVRTVRSRLASERIISKHLVANQTCKHLNAVSHERIVWLDVFDWICDSHTVMKGIYPLLEMSSVDLESASTRHLRFLQATLHQTGKMGCHSACLLDGDKLLRSNSTPDLTTRINTVMLFPGGRYLVAVWGIRVLSFWDLGIPGKVVEPHCITQSYLLDGQQADKKKISHTYLQQPRLAPDGSTFRFILTVGFEL